MDKPAPLLVCVQGLVADFGFDLNLPQIPSPLSKVLESILPNITGHTFKTIVPRPDGSDGAHSSTSSTKCPNFHQRASELLKFIDNKRRRNPLVSTVANCDGADDNAPPPLILAGHDLGGVLIKQALVVSSSDTRWNWIAKSTVAAIFIETPSHNPTDRCSWERAIIQIMALATATNKLKLDCMSFLKSLPVSASQIEEQFCGLPANFQSVNLYAKASPIRPTVHLPPPWQSEIYTQLDFLESGVGEAWSMKEDDPAVKSLCQQLLPSCSTAAGVSINGQIQPPFIDCVSDRQKLSRYLQAQLGEWQQLQVPFLVPFTPPIFDDWVSGAPWYENWTKRGERSILHIASPSGTGVNSFTSSIASRLREAGKAVFVFSMLAFTQQTHADAVSPGTLLFAAICRALLQRTTISDSNGTQGGSSYRWLLCDRVLTRNIVRGLLCSLLSSRGIGSTIFCIVHDLHTVSQKEQSRLAEDLDIVMDSSACILKVLIATDDQTAAWESACHPTFRVDFREKQFKYNEFMRRFAMVRLSSFASTRAVWRQKQPDLRSAALEKVCGESATMLELCLKLDLMESVTTAETTSEIEEMISRMPLSVEETVERVLCSRPDLEPLALTALAWILTSLRPLGLSELAVCVALKTGPAGETEKTAIESIRSRISWDISKDLSLALGPLVTVSGDRAVIRHRALKAYLDNRIQPLIGPDSNLFLLQMCLGYVKLIRGSWSSSSKEDVTDDDLQRELFLAKYATEAWPGHALLSLDQEKATELVVEFLDSESFSTWLSMLRHFGLGPSCQIPKSAVEAACSFGLLGVVDEFLKRAPAPLTEPLKGQFIVGLDRASEKGHVLVVERILKEGIRSANASRTASRYGRTTVLESLKLSSPLDVEDKDDYGLNALLEASRGGHLRTVDFLLNTEGADVNAKTNEGLTSLHFAGRIGHASVIEKLLASPEVAVSPVDDQGYTPLMYAAWAGFADIVEKLASRLSIDDAGDADNTQRDASGGHSAVAVSTDEGSTALHLAVSGGHPRVVELLLRFGANPETVDNNDFTPLHIAAKLGLLEIAKLLIKASEKPKGLSHAGEHLTTRPVSFTRAVAESPLGLAVANRHSEIIRELLDSRQHANTKTAFQAVSYACTNGYLNPVVEILRWHRDRNHGHDDADDHGSGPAFLQSEHGQTALHLAVEFGHPALVMGILKENLVPVDTPDRAGWTPLHTAAKLGDIAIVEILLKNEAALDTTTDQGKSVLHIAAQYGHAALCQRLWQRASDSLRNKRAHGGLLPVSLAVEHGHVEAVKVLLQLSPETTSHEGLLHLAVKHGSQQLLDEILAAKPSLNWTNSEQETAVHFAVSHERIAMVKRLHEAGANMAAKDVSGRTPLFRAVEKENVDMVKALIALDAELDVDGANYQKITPLLKICASESFWNGNPQPVIDITRLLLEKYASNVNINVAHPYGGRTPLHYSTDSDSDELTEILLHHKANPNSKNRGGSTPIFLAAKMGKDNSVKALLKAGAKASIRNNNHSTPLHRAASNGHVDCIDILMEFPRNNAKKVLNVKDTYGYTPLALAAMNGFTECVKKLLDYGPDLMVLTDHGLTPLGLAAEADNEDTMEELFKVMEAKGPSDIEQTVRSAAANKHDVVVRTLVNKTKNPNIQDDRHGSVLGVAVAHEAEEVARVLLAIDGIETEHKDTAGRTPLLVATQKGNYKLVKALTEANAKPNAKDMEGSWPLFYAIVLKHERIAQHLLQLDDIKLDEVDARGYGNLYWACRVNQSAIFTMVNEAVRDLACYYPMRDAAIHACVASNNSQALRALLESSDANCDIQGPDGWTPLYTTKCYGFSEVEEILIAKGADPEAQTAQTAKGPSRWHAEDKGAGLSVQGESQNDIEVTTTTYTPDGADTQTSIARADYPLRGQENWYFELRIVRGYQDEEQGLGIGIADDQASRGGRLLGFHGGNQQSYGYHADNGKAYPNYHPREMESAQTYDEGDVVGCGYIYEKKAVYFTRNGFYLGVAFENVMGKFYPAVFMDTGEVGVEVTARFDPALWDFNPESSPWAANWSSDRRGSEGNDDDSQAWSSSSLQSQTESDYN